MVIKLSMSTAKEVIKNKASTTDDTISKFNDDLVLAVSEGDTKRARILSVVIKRLQKLKKEKRK